MSEKSPIYCDNCNFVLEPQLQNIRNQTIEEVLKIVDKEQCSALRGSFKWGILDYIKEEIKKIQSPESMTPNSMLNGNASKDTNTQRSGCGEPLHIGSCHFVFCGEGGYNNDKWLCEKCQEKVK